MTDRPYHKFKVGSQQFEIESKYELISPVGHGAYGVVISAKDKSSNTNVAIKKIPRAFDEPTDAKRILREIKLMKKFNHENVIRIVDLIPPPPTADEFEDIYIVQDLMETDLHRIIYSTQPLSIDHVQYFVYQLLRGLKYIHSANVLHRDLKPSNLLVNSNCDLKICDFGLARHMEDEWSGTRTEYVVTRWYRAPEIMLACTEYSKAIDVWSAGCIFAELLARQPMFPGSDYIAQLRLIHGKLGRPSEQELDFITSERAKRFMLSLSAKPPTDMATLFPQYRGETEALDLLAKMLTFLPSKRISVEDALAHPFMASLHNPDDEPSLNYTFSFPFENEDLSREKIQDLIWHEIRELHPEMSENPPSGGSRLKSSSRLDADSKADSKSEEADEKKRSHSGDDDSKASRKRSISPDPGYK